MISAAGGETGTEWTTFCWDVIARGVWIHDNDFKVVCIKLQEILYSTARFGPRWSMPL